MFCLFLTGYIVYWIIGGISFDSSHIQYIYICMKISVFSWKNQKISFISSSYRRHAQIKEPFTNLPPEFAGVTAGVWPLDPHSVETTTLYPSPVMTFTHCLPPFLPTYQPLIANNVEETASHLNGSFTYPGGEPLAFMSYVPTVGYGTFRTLQTGQDGTLVG